MCRCKREEIDPLGKLVDVCEDKKDEWLQIRHSEGLNQALPGNWLCRFLIEREREGEFGGNHFRNFEEVE